MTAPSPAHWQRPQPHIQSPVAEYLRAQQHQQCPGVNADHIVLSRRALEDLPTELQQQATHVLRQLHQLQPAHAAYRVTPLRWAPINTLDSSRLAEADITPEVDDNGDLSYYDHRNRRWIPEDETSLQVLVSDNQVTGRDAPAEQA